MTQLQGVSPGVQGLKTLSSLIPIVPSDPAMVAEHERWLGLTVWIPPNLQLYGEAAQHGQSSGREQIREITNGEFDVPSFRSLPPFPPPPAQPSTPPIVFPSPTPPSAPSNPFTGTNIQSPGEPPPPWTPPNTPPWVPPTPDTPQVTSSAVSLTGTSSAMSTSGSSVTDLPTL